MLSKQEALCEFEDGRVLPDKLTRNAHPQYVALAAEMLAVYRDGIGQTREDLHRAIDQIFFREAKCPPRRVAAFCKLLDDRSQFDGADGDDAAELRMRVFGMAASKHPLVVQPQGLLEHCEAAVKDQIAVEMKRPWSQIETELFRDVLALHRLREFCPFESAEAFLRRYNEAQLQAALYDATSMRITARRDYKSIITAVKLARLMHTAVRNGDGFEFIIDGPTALLRETRRYGVLMAHIIPTLLRCADWELRAPIKKFHQTDLQPELVIRSGDYRSSVDAPAEFDSKLEETFAKKWGEEPRDGWILKRESEPRFVHQKAFFPDFTFEHETGTRVLFEIIGFWTHGYLQSKRETVLQFRDEPLLLAVKKDSVEDFVDLGIPIVEFGSSLKLEPVLNALARFI